MSVSRASGAGEFGAAGSIPGVAALGGFLTLITVCPVHGERNRADRRDHLLDQLDGHHLWVIEVENGREWAALRQRFHRDPTKVVGAKIPIGDGRLMVFHDLPGEGRPIIGDRQHLAALLDDALDSYADASDGLKITGIGGITTTAPKASAGTWEPKAVTNRGRFQVWLTLQEAGMAPIEVPDDQLPDDFEDAFDFSMPEPGSWEWELFLQITGAIPWEEWLRFRSRSDTAPEEVAA